MGRPSGANVRPKTQENQWNCESRELRVLLYSSTRGSHATMTSIRRIRAVLRFASVLALFCTVALAQLSKIETGTEAWLRYSALTAQAAQSYQSLPSHIVLLGDSALAQDRRAGVGSGRCAIARRDIAGRGPLLATECHCPGNSQSTTRRGSGIASGARTSIRCLLVEGGQDSRVAMFDCRRGQRPRGFVWSVCAVKQDRARRESGSHR